MCFAGIAVFVGICDGAACTFFNEEYGDSAADTAVTTGDEGNLVKKLTCSRTIIFGDGLRSYLFLMGLVAVAIGLCGFFGLPPFCINGCFESEGNYVARVVVI